MGKKLCRYVLQMHRSSDIEGIFIMTDEELDLVKELNGHVIRYGEISGKHSNVKAELNMKDIKILSDKEEEIAFFERVLPNGTGFSFKEYWFCSEEAYDKGYDAEMYYEKVEDALKSQPLFDNKVMRESFINGFNDSRESKNDDFIDEN